MTVLKPFVPAPGPELLQKLGTESALNSLGYSMWKTGLEAFTKAEKAGQSEYWMHCSLTENWNFRVSGLVLHNLEEGGSPVSRV